MYAHFSGFNTLACFYSDKDANQGLKNTFTVYCCQETLSLSISATAPLSGPCTVDSHIAKNLKAVFQTDTMQYISIKSTLGLLKSKWSNI